MTPVTSYCAGHATSAKPPRHLAVRRRSPSRRRRGRPLRRQDPEVVAVERRRRWPSLPSGRPSAAACATRSPSGLRFSPRTAGQYRPFCLPGSLPERPARNSPRACRRARAARRAAARRRRSRQIRITASSLRPIRRASTSSLPAAVSNRQPFAPSTSGTGNGQSSLPMTSVLRSGPLVDQPPAFGHRDGEHLAMPAARVAGSDESTSSLPSGPKIATARFGLLAGFDRRRPARARRLRAWRTIGCVGGASARQRGASALRRQRIVAGGDHDRCDVQRLRARSPPPPPPELLRLRWPRELAARSDFPLE